MTVQDYLSNNINSYMISKELKSSLITVDEDLIKQAAKLIGGQNTFTKLLKYGEEYRRAGLDPIYVSNADMSSFAVTCNETFGQDLH